MVTIKVYFLPILFFSLLPIIGIAQSTNESPEKKEQFEAKEKKIKTPIILPDFDTSTTIFQKIQRDSFFEVILQTNFDSLLKNKKVSSEKYTGTILFKNEKGESFKTKVKIEPRGRSRRKVCSMPPLKIDFPKKALDKLGLYPGGDKLKLVTNCNDNENSDQVLMKEYWIYKLYNEITPESYQVFPVKITYVNSNNTEERFEHFAFFIESNEELALRLKSELVTLYGTTPAILTTNSYHNTLLFQYMIGNLDWNLSVGRNVKFLKQQNGEKHILVPYDFDYSGLVKAPHARLNPDYGQKYIEQRFPQGKFANKADLQKTIDMFNTHKKAGFNCFNQCQTLTKSEKKKMHRYLGSFYKLLRDKAYMEELFLE